MTDINCPKTSQGWEGRYREGDTPWDLGGPPPVLADVIESVGIQSVGGARLRVIVPGAGFGHDAIQWAAAGHDVTMVEIAATAIAGARKLAQAARVEVAFVEEDLFALPERYLGAFDIVWEHTCFCAFDPSLRSAYAEQTARWLRPGGRMLALLWNHGVDGGPPFDVTREAARAAFEPHYAIESLEPVLHSAAPRKNEFLLRMRRLAAED